MSAAARIIIDSAADLGRRIHDFDRRSPAYPVILEGYKRLALEPGSALFLCSPNCAEFLFHWIAALACGYVPCAIAPSTRTARIRAIQHSLGISGIVGPNLDSPRYQPRQVERIGSFAAILGERIAPPYEPFDAILLTTGTSGAQTACVHTVDTLAWNASSTNRALNITSADRQLIVLPLYHSYGLVTQSIGSIISGCELRIDGPPFNAERFGDLIQAERISICGITPTIARRLLEQRTELPPVRSFSIGGDCVSREEVTALLAKRFVKELYITYGLTEAGPRVSVLPAHDASPEAYDSVGRPFDGVVTRIRRPDSNGAGELLVRTPSACRRKVGDNVLKQPFTPDGFLETGDTFTQDRAGLLRYVARQKDVLIIKGEKLNTRSIDQAAQSHPDVEFARTAEGESSLLVTRLWARGDKRLDLDEIRAFMKASLPLHEVPDRLVQECGRTFHK